MTIFKMFEEKVSSDLEKQVNDFLKENPRLTPLNMQLATNDHHALCLAVMFGEVLSPFEVDRNPFAVPFTQPVPYVPPQEITCDDPWKGEFYPVGDPPMNKPRMTDPGASTRRVANSLGFGMTS